MKLLGRTCALALATAAVAACGKTTFMVGYAQDAAPLMAEYRSYAWLRPAPGQAKRPHEDLVGLRIQRTVDSVLNAKGFLRNDSTPDFLVGYHLAYTGDLDRDAVDTYFGFGFGSNEPGADSIPQGTLIIDVVDAAQQRLVWRGGADINVDPNTLDARERNRRIRDGVGGILTDFPPSQ